MCLSAVEIAAQPFDLVAQFHYLSAQLGHLCGQVAWAPDLDRPTCWRHWRHGRRGGVWQWGRELLGPALLLLAGLAREPHHERFRPGAEALELGLDMAYAVEVAHALSAQPQLTSCLWAPEEKDRQQGDLLHTDRQVLVEYLLVTGDAPAVGGVVETYKPSGFERRQGGMDGGLVVFHHGVPVGGLVARQQESVDRQGVLLGGRQVFLDEAPDHTPFLWAQSHWGDTTQRARGPGWLRRPPKAGVWRTMSRTAGELSRRWCQPLSRREGKA